VLRRQHSGSASTFFPAWRPSFWLRRHFFVLCLLAAVSGCATPPAVEPTSPTLARTPESPQVIDERGPLDSAAAAEAVRRLGRKGEGDHLADHLAHVEDAVTAPLVLGNDARLLIDGPQTYRAMFKAIAEARSHIHLETYIVESDETGERLATALEAKRAEGVSVALLFDGVGSIGTPPEYFKRLAAAGVAVCEFNPVKSFKAWRINNRDHRKLLIVDGRIAFTGGINISSVYRAGSFGSKWKRPKEKEGWRDTHVLASGPVVAEFQRLFLDSWVRQHCPPLPDRNYFPRQERRGDKAMRVVAADPGIDQSEFYIALLSSIGKARQRAWLTYGYFVPDRRMLQALTDAARRGADVRLVLPGFSDFGPPFHAGRSHYTELLTAGVRIFERRDALLHAKTAVIDGVWSSVGSTNLDWRSFVHNYEADLLVLDPGFARELEELFRLDESASHEVSLAEWHERGIGTRLKEWLARPWEYLL
jgi:cardiolipin synthase A/B